VLNFHIKKEAFPEEINREVENMGAKVLAQYVVLGQYDFIEKMT